MNPDEESKEPTASDPKNAEGKPDEQQMADWEEALKNDDWGHQPC